MVFTRERHACQKRLPGQFLSFSREGESPDQEINRVEEALIGLVGQDKAVIAGVARTKKPRAQTLLSRLPVFMGMFGCRLRAGVSVSLPEVPQEAGRDSLGTGSRRLSSCASWNGGVLMPDIFVIGASQAEGSLIRAETLRRLILGREPLTTAEPETDREVTAPLA